jgi:hypothetical protein
MSEISACGLLCRECKFLGTACHGCVAAEGKPFWVADYAHWQCLFNRQE